MITSGLELKKMSKTATAHVLPSSRSMVNPLVKNTSSQGLTPVRTATEQPSLRSCTKAEIVVKWPHRLTAASCSCSSKTSGLIFAKSALFFALRALFCSSVSNDFGPLAVFPCSLVLNFVYPCDSMLNVATRSSNMGALLIGSL